MKLNTLNTIIDDILLELRNSNIANTESISRIQIEQWIINYRTLLIKQDIDKGRTINPQYVQTLSNIHLERIEPTTGKYLYQSEITLPKLIDFHYKTGLVNVTDLYGNPIQIGNRTKVKFQRTRKYTAYDYLAYMHNNKLYVEGNDNNLEYINADIIAENPADIAGVNGECFDPNGQYPVPANMISVIKQMIFANELNIMPQMRSDKTNNGNDDTQNEA